MAMASACLWPAAWACRPLPTLPTPPSRLEVSADASGVGGCTPWTPQTGGEGWGTHRGARAGHAPQGFWATAHGRGFAAPHCPIDLLRCPAKQSPGSPMDPLHSPAQILRSQDPPWTPCVPQPIKAQDLTWIHCAPQPESRIPHGPTALLSQPRLRIRYNPLHSPAS